MRYFAHVLGLAIVIAVAAHAGLAHGQGYGSDLQNVMGPASGGMAGVSTARPQDVPSAIFGNPATLAQFEGTQFTLGGGWMEGYPTVTNDGTRHWGHAVQRHVADRGWRGYGDRRGPGSSAPRVGRHIRPGRRRTQRRRRRVSGRGPGNAFSTMKAVITWCWESTWGPASR